MVKAAQQDGLQSLDDAFDTRHPLFKRAQTIGDRPHLCTHPGDLDGNESAERDSRRDNGNDHRRDFGHGNILQQQGSVRQGGAFARSHGVEDEPMRGTGGGIDVRTPYARGRAGMMRATSSLTSGSADGAITSPAT